MRDISVSLYFTPDWWDRYYHLRYARPVTPARSALEAMYQGRRRFLAEQLPLLQLGDDSASAPGQLATVIRYGFDLVPVLLGTQMDYAEAWGFFPRVRTLQEVRHLRPVDIRRHPEGEWLVRRRERLAQLYGGASHCVDVGSVTNNAFRILGDSFYADLLEYPDEIQALFETLLATMRGTQELLAELFGEDAPVPISNCNVPMLGPSLYERSIRPFDARQNRFNADRRGGAPRAALHHCDVPVDTFIEAYAGLPGLASLQASFESDVAAVKRGIPGCAFSAMISPLALSGDVAVLRAKLDRALAGGADDLAVWNIDPDATPERLRESLSLILDVARQHDGSAHFSAMPLCWEEIEWAHRCYHGASLATPGPAWQDL